MSPENSPYLASALENAIAERGGREISHTIIYMYMYEVTLEVSCSSEMGSPVFFITTYV